MGEGEPVLQDATPEAGGPSPVAAIAKASL